MIIQRILRGLKASLKSLLVIPALAMVTLVACADEAPPADYTVYKNPNCVCCEKWATQMREAGHSVDLAPTPRMEQIKERFGIDRRLRSCHTTVHNATGLVFEGHVPIEHVVSFVSDPVAGARGLAVPGMPVGSPGMEVGDRKDPYFVILMNEEGEPSFFSHENMPEEQ